MLVFGPKYLVVWHSFPFCTLLITKLSEFLHPVFSTRLIVVSNLSSFHIKTWYFSLSRLLVWVTSSQVLFPLLCLLYTLVFYMYLSWFGRFLIPLLSDLSFHFFCCSFMVWSFYIVPLLTIFGFYWAEFVLFILGWCDSSVSSIEILLKGMIKFRAPFKLPCDIVGSPVSSWYSGMKLFPWYIALVRVLCCSKLWFPFSSGCGVSVFFHGSSRGGVSFKLGAYEKSYLLGVVLRHVPVFFLRFVM